MIYLYFVNYNYYYRVFRPACISWPLFWQKQLNQCALKSPRKFNALLANPLPTCEVNVKIVKVLPTDGVLLPVPVPVPENAPAPAPAPAPIPVPENAPAPAPIIVGASVLVPDVQTRFKLSK
jgi:hypothetical protein